MKGIKIYALTLLMAVMTVFGSISAAAADVYTVKIKDDIKNTGNLKAEVYKNGSPASLPDGTYIEWYNKLKTESAWKRIIPTKYASGAVNITETTLGCNAVFSGGARTAAGIVQYRAVITRHEDGAEVVASDPFDQDNYWGEVQNAGFEDWPIDLDTLNNVTGELKIVAQRITAKISEITKLSGKQVYYNQIRNGLKTEVVWKSAVAAQGAQAGYDIEIARTETDNQKFTSWLAYRANEVSYKGANPVTIIDGQSASEANVVQWLTDNPTEYPGQRPSFAAPEGYQFAEINSEQDGALYQDILTEPGGVINWGLYHCARISHIARKGDVDEMYVICMATKDAEEMIDKYKDNMDGLRAELMLIAEKKSSYKGTVWTISDKVEDGWVYRSSNDPGYDKYIVPENQYLTRYFFVANRTACGSMSGGNMIDGMYCGNEPVKPQANQIILVVKKDFGGELKPEDIAALKSRIKVDCTVNGNTIVIGSDSYPFIWSASDKGRCECRMDVPLGQKTSITIKEQRETALVDCYDLTVNYSSNGGSDAGRTATGYVLKAQGGDVITVTISNNYAKSKKELIIRKNGLKTGESSIFTVRKAGESIALYRLLLTGTDGETATATISNVPVGEYTVEETGWSWAYDPEQASITQDISEENGNVFTFNNAPKETAPLHDEKYKVNKIVGNN